MNILSIDLEDWFHILDHPDLAWSSTWETMPSRIENNTDRILQLLDSKNIRATFFCLGWVARRYLDLIKRIASKHEVACHSMFHTLVYSQKPDDFKKDLHENIELLVKTSGKNISAYRAPGFSFTSETKWMVPILAEAGIKYDCSVFPLKRNHGGYEDFPVVRPCKIVYKDVSLMEFPMNTTSFFGKKIIFSGGGYFRLLPYSFIRRSMNTDYVMTYFHPRDFDPGQPVIGNLNFKRKFMSYVGLKKSFSKFERLVNDYKFITVEEAGKQTDWNAAPIINLDNI